MITPGHGHTHQMDCSAGSNRGRGHDCRFITGTIADGIAKVRAEPEIYQSIFYWDVYLSHSPGEQEYTLVKRGKGSGMIFTPEDNGKMHHLAAIFIAMDADVQCNNDTVTDGLLARGYEGYALPSTLRPGRGDGEYMAACQSATQSTTQSTTQSLSNECCILMMFHNCVVVTVDSILLAHNSSWCVLNSLT